MAQYHAEPPIAKSKTSRKAAVAQLLRNVQMLVRHRKNRDEQSFHGEVAEWSIALSLNLSGGDEPSIRPNRIFSSI